MIFELFKPTDLLGRFVDNIVFYKDYAPEHSIEKLMPDAHTYLLFNLDDTPKYIFDNVSLMPIQKCTGVWFSGMMHQSISISAGNMSSMMVICFKPGGAYSLLNFPMHLVGNAVVDAHAVIGPETATIMDQIQNTSCVSAKIDVVCTWLNDRISPDGKPLFIDYAISRLTSDPAISTINAVADEIGICGKTFVRSFKEYIGMTPKYFQRVLRFNQVLDTIDSSGDASWTSIAHDCGYYDQAHFIREFKHFSGYTPTVFSTQRGDRVNFIAVD